MIVTESLLPRRFLASRVALIPRYKGELPNVPFCEASRLSRYRSRAVSLPHNHSITAFKEVKTKGPLRVKREKERTCYRVQDGPARKQSRYSTTGGRTDQPISSLSLKSRSTCYNRVKSQRITITLRRYYLYYNLKFHA